MCWPRSTRAPRTTTASRATTNGAPSADGLPDPLDRRVRHVITENERVDAAVDAVERRDLPQLGRLLDASHASLRDDYEVSVPEVESAVAEFKRAGALGDGV